MRSVSLSDKHTKARISQAKTRAKHKARVAYLEAFLAEMQRVFPLNAEIVDERVRDLLANNDTSEFR